ncbi:MAG TPA: hypothetical protein VHA37_06665, partial [Candidatus Saccharimonadales bacterium]|nr:hypothetical protein [Candidatus Saccharimonadales bacterium]
QDLFVISSGAHGADSITDFNMADHDTLLINDNGAPLVFSDDGTNTTISSAFGTIDLEGVSGQSSGWFHFSAVEVINNYSEAHYGYDAVVVSSP